MVRLKGLIERLRQAAQFGRQWDRYLSGVLWAYRDTPHESTGEKPSFLLFGVDCRAPAESSFLPPTEPVEGDARQYRTELMGRLLSSRQVALEAIRRAQRRNEKYYNRLSPESIVQVGDWTFIAFPHEETGKNRKLSQLWHRPYRVMGRHDVDITARKVYAPDDPEIRVHLSRVKPCPAALPVGFYYYGGNRKSRGRIPLWVEKFLGDQAGKGENNRPYNLRPRV